MDTALSIYKRISPDKLHTYKYSSTKICQFELYCSECPADNPDTSYRNCGFTSITIKRIFTAIMKEKHPEFFL